MNIFGCNPEYPGFRAINQYFYSDKKKKNKITYKNLSKIQRCLHKHYLDYIIATWWWWCSCVNLECSCVVFWNLKEKERSWGRDMGSILLLGLDKMETSLHFCPWLEFLILSRHASLQGIHLFLSSQPPKRNLSPV